MYYPILRAKQFELIALREIASKNPSFYRSFTPILEPVNDSHKPLIRAIETLNGINVTPLVIINPAVGKIQQQWLEEEYFEGLNYIPTIDFNSDNEKQALSKALQLGVKNIAALADGCSTSTLKALKGLKLLIIETEITQAKRYQSGLNSKVVLLKDGFKRKSKNAEYSGRSTFISAISDFKEFGLHGFSDFTTTGSFFSEGGGPAYVVAIHLTELSSDDSGFGPAAQILVNHYTSADNGTAVDPAGKFMEALTKLIDDVEPRKDDFFISSGLQEFMSLYEQKHFPGLGTAKKNSIKHHIETIADYLNNNA
jgi:hypothetical protein